MLKPAVKRSACDKCRAKRVRCLRAQDSMAPCARCCHMGARCVTGAPGQPGRPPKQRRAVSAHHVEDHTPAMTVVSAAHPHSPRDPVAHEPQPDFWVMPDNISAFFGSASPSMDHSPVPGRDILTLADQLSNRSQLQGFLNTNDESNTMLHMGRHSSTALDIDIDPLLDYGEGLLPPTLLPHCLSAASSLVRFQQEIDQRIAMIGAYYSEPSIVLQRCKDGSAGRDVENPAALLLTCSKELTDIIQSLMPGNHLHHQTEDALSTEILLLVLSSYLALMRLFDSAFHRIYEYLCQAPPESYESLKVKSVLRIGGVSSLQDMPLKTYAIGILDAIQGQVQTLERCMGIPAEYCLSDEAVFSSTAIAPGIFSNTRRAQLFWVVMAQGDAKSRWSSKSYVESTRASIKESIAFLNN